jgi:hypothetical protein
VASPIPDEAPVMTATRPWFRSELMKCLLCLSRRQGPFKDGRSVAECRRCTADTIDELLGRFKGTVLEGVHGRK